METAQPMNKIERAHQMYRDGRYEEALSFYTEALAMAKTKAQKIALHSNRAACYLKLHDFKMAADECTSVLELDHKHTGALMLRAQTLVTLKEYQSALFDVNRLIELNPSSEVYQNLQASLKTQVSLAPIPEDEGEEEDEDEWQQKDERAQEKEVGGESEKDTEDSIVSNDNNGNFGSTALRTEITSFGTQKVENERTPLSIAVTTSQTHSTKELSDQYSSGWRAIPKPKGHSHLDYSRWDRVEDDSREGEDEDDSDEESQPPYRFRVRTVGVRQIK